MQVLQPKTKWVVWLLAGLSLASIILGLIILAQGGNTVMILTRARVHFMPQPAIINILAAIGALGITFLAARRKRQRSPTVLILVAAIAITGMLISLMFRDDYSGGSCGEFDWPAGHLHAGYPYSWLDGEVCVPPQYSIREYTNIHPEQAYWFPDLPALIVDLLFWANAGILVSGWWGVIPLNER